MPKMRLSPLWRKFQLRLPSLLSQSSTIPVREGLPTIQEELSWSRGCPQWQVRRPSGCELPFRHDETVEELLTI
jgi:hypothetical protein